MEMICIGQYVVECDTMEWIPKMIKPNQVTICFAYHMHCGSNESI